MRKIVNYSLKSQTGPPILNSDRSTNNNFVYALVTNEFFKNQFKSRPTLAKLNKNTEIIILHMKFYHNCTIITITIGMLFVAIL